MTDIPADVMKLAREVAIGAAHDTGGCTCIACLDSAQPNIARAILADRAAQAERMARMEEAVSFVARWAWRTDPPNATGHLTDTDRLSCIKHHPTIKNAAQPHIELAEAEASRALSQEGSDA